MNNSNSLISLSSQSSTDLLAAENLKASLDVSDTKSLDADKENQGIKNTVDAPAPIDISHIYEFLGAPTPKAWLDAALQDLPTIIQDHANCEKKAAGTAMNLIFRYEFHRDLQLKLAQLIREEMLHYEQVVGIMETRGQQWRHLPAGRYAKSMLSHKRTYEPGAMIDVLIIGAFIEARSCERFAALSNVVEDERLAKYYRYLLKSESRHYEDYIMLARSLVPEQNIESKPNLKNKQKSAQKNPNHDSEQKAKTTDPHQDQLLDLKALQKSTNASINNNSETLNVDDRIAYFRDIESELITTPDKELRFHSGIPS